MPGNATSFKVMYLMVVQGFFTDRCKALMTNLLLSILTAVAKFTKARFVKKAHQIEAVQEQFLCHLLLAPSRSFSTMKSVAQM